MSEKKQLNMGLAGIEILETSMTPPKNPINSKTVFGFDVNLEQGANLDKELAIITVTTSINDDVEKVRLGYFKASCIYKIENLKQFHDSESNRIIYPPQISMTLNSMTLSTVRGLMFSNFKGTFLHGAVLPMVPLDNLQKSEN